MAEARQWRRTLFPIEQADGVFRVITTDGNKLAQDCFFFVLEAVW
jgi:hypothetical protein